MIHEPEGEEVFIPCGGTSSPRVYHTTMKCQSLPDNPKPVALSTAEWKGLKKCAWCTEAEQREGEE